MLCLFLNLVVVMRFKLFFIFLTLVGVAFAGSYIPSSQTSSGHLHEQISGVYDYLNNVVKSVCLLSGLFLTVGGVYQYSQHKKDPVSVPFTKVIVMFFCAFCALFLAYLPGVVV